MSDLVQAVKEIERKVAGAERATRWSTAVLAFATAVMTPLLLGTFGRIAWTDITSGSWWLVVVCDVPVITVAVVAAIKTYQIVREYGRVCDRAGSIREELSEQFAVASQKLIDDLIDNGKKQCEEAYREGGENMKRNAVALLRQLASRMAAHGIHFELDFGGEVIRSVPTTDAAATPTGPLLH